MAEVVSQNKLFVPQARFSESLSPPRRRNPAFLPIRPVSAPRFRSLSGFYGEKMIFGERGGNFGERGGKLRKGDANGLRAHMSLSIGKILKWWEKGLQCNMKEIESAKDLVESLLNTGNKLVIVDFFSPGCGGCRALHPKICQIAEMNPDVLFLQVNYEKHKSMCYSLNVHVLPFFRFYRGAQGRLCSFSCTNATIKKFKDALAKHSTDRCSLAPAKGLDESELLALASNKELSFNCTKKPQPILTPDHTAEPVPASRKLVPASRAIKESEDKFLVGAGI